MQVCSPPYATVDDPQLHVVGDVGVVDEADQGPAGVAGAGPGAAPLGGEKQGAIVTTWEENQEREREREKKDPLPVTSNPAHMTSGRKRLGTLSLAWVIRWLAAPPDWMSWDELQYLIVIVVDVIIIIGKVLKVVLYYVPTSGRKCPGWPS